MMGIIRDVVLIARLAFTSETIMPRDSLGDMKSAEIDLRYG
ncbi:MAG: hypothetical protein ACLUKN_05065 [Bacilli bacterium]